MLLNKLILIVSFIQYKALKINEKKEECSTIFGFFVKENFVIRYYI